MHIDWNHFTPLSALLGGALIGLSAALLLIVNGRILGVSGILGGILGGVLDNLWHRHPTQNKRDELRWRVLLILGMMSAPLVYLCFAPLPVFTLSASPLLLISAGLLVGIGTRYGAGCTSGHGICGLGRFSIRSLVATLCFMGSGMLTTYLLRHVLV